VYIWDGLIYGAKYSNLRADKNQYQTILCLYNYTVTRNNAMQNRRNAVN